MRRLILMALLFPLGALALLVGPFLEILKKEELDGDQY
ncbi:hypothetical protein J2S23_000508 [Streptococcus moroccensis]|uniref:Uncharacterized protein n=1 Tax=Streptococcus moroccensis TaxID=1451356 RepID=A0ABT9YPP7_9STRE|nr:hypothetical protein [Streptococcus moroccensis]